MRKEILLKLYELNGEYISGNDLAKMLGISRVAVWKHIEALKQEGYDITGIAGKGYSLNNWTSVIIPEEIKTKIKDNKLIGDILFYPELTSTNQLGKELVSKGSEGLVIVASKQSNGKGRLGRKWESPVGGLWFSLVFKTDLALHELPLLSLIFALAIAKALDSFLPVPTSIKWPNDVLLRGKKVAGILLEVSGQMDGIDSVVAGIGINVNVKPEDWSEDISQIATSLWQETGKEIPNQKVLTEVLIKLDEYYQEFVVNGFDKIRDQFKEKCFHLGKEIEIKQVNKVVSGINIDINYDGSLLLNSQNRIIHVTTGDVNII